MKTTLPFYSLYAQLKTMVSWASYTHASNSHVGKLKERDQTEEVS